MAALAYTLVFFCALQVSKGSESTTVLLPVKTTQRHIPTSLSLTDIGEFGIVRKARPGIAAHYHTGIDIKRPGGNYQDEPIFAVAAGVVISKRTDGPYAQLIIEHQLGNERVWTVYEHIAGIAVNAGDEVDPFRPIARFMNTAELNKYGWQFDHFHFEVLKERPVQLKTNAALPERHFASYTLMCYTKADLTRYFLNPQEFFRGML